MLNDKVVIACIPVYAAIPFLENVGFVSNTTQIPKCSIKPTRGILLYNGYVVYAL
jgi:hypothetical protein